eukprot:1138462-Pelagomonas_calceolata.AAC.2
MPCKHETGLVKSMRPKVRPVVFTVKAFMGSKMGCHKIKWCTLVGGEFENHSDDALRRWKNEDGILIVPGAHQVQHIKDCDVIKGLSN